MKTAVGYVRVSTQGQAEDGVSLDAQREKIEQWCELNGHRLDQVYVDAGLSGCRADNRPALQKAMDHACRDRSALVVYALSRLARSTKDALDISERLDKAKADLVSLSERIDTTSAAGKMIYRLMAVMAEFERDQIAERTSTAMRYKKRQGQYIGGRAPYGYAVADGELVPVVAEQRVLRLVVKCKEQGLGLNATARHISKKHVSRAGKPFSAQQIKQMLRNNWAEYVQEYKMEVI